MFFPYKDDNPRILFPFVTYTIIGINSLVFIYQYLILPPESLGHIISTYALTPAAPSVITVFTSMFMHGGLMHIIFNMWFLWIFGDNIESVLGHKRYVLFYLLCGVGAALAQIQINTGSQIPMVGASGAIAGVLGAYLIRFPRATVHVLVILIIFITFIRVPAMVVIGIWFLSNLTAGLGTLGIEETGGTAWFAHLGGFVSGVVLNQVFKQIRIE
ncbi:FIG056164: rhomboid family serine protease [hydrothermal vent metagenome]|jgi:membrane associated rhomboid family serine protease|uniref:FIG056164: rhomboid family serine protease n=1 Tax=hydrothermal vent metagenome TaxID=652676 RepID=A0A160VDI1_9ZZZZ|nr:MAG: rhomboid family intramembrane serine protease [Candidatus Neomarinimicrobiota bacterium]|tara:strand:- start:249 stop:893 length:645 start_codon:yes stop_codon:yes gene_type:complete